MDTKTEIIEKIINEFDFRTVYDYIVHSKQETFNGKELSQPSIEDLKNTARSLLEKAYSEKEIQDYIVAYGTCNFEASKTSDGLLSLRYYIAETELDLDDFFSNF